jgi:outer membrane protein assembly factor BamB
MKRLICLAGLLALLAACDKKAKPDEPAKLLPINATLKVQGAWSASLSDEPKLRSGLGLGVVGDTVYIAGYKGDVAALTLAGGKQKWRVDTRTPLTGGPGAGVNLVAVGTAKGEVIALDAASGAQKWRVKVGALLLAAPAVTDDAVIVRTIDGKLRALEAASGKQRWLTDQQLPRLLLRGTAPPVVSEGIVLQPFDNGRLVAITLAGGTTQWDTAVAQAHGSSELQRLVDIDSPVRVDGSDIFVVSYQGRVARIARDSGQTIWAKDLSSYRGLAIDDEFVYVSTAGGEIVKLDRSSGAEIWNQSVLKRRQLSAPAVGGGYLLVADLDGVVHWLNTSDGRFVARQKVGERVSAAPVYANGVWLVRSDKGSVHAYKTPG